MKKDEKQYVLCLGAGAREHALVEAIADNKTVSIIAAPGNPGIGRRATCVAIGPEEKESLVAFAKGIAREYPLLTVVGPEVPLANGIVDAFREHNLSIIGPTSAAAQIESDKAFALAQMWRRGIPTGRYTVFAPHSVEEMHDAQQYALTVLDWDKKVVIKANGLAAGKGVYPCESTHDVRDALEALMIKRLHGRAGEKFVLMEHLGGGQELGMFWLVDINGHIAYIGSAQDHKRLYDGDRGPNTGGLGAYSPVPFVDESLIARVRTHIVWPMLDGMTDDGIPYSGFLYVGLIMTNEGPKVVEWNCRLGDPEAQVLLPLLKTDVLSLLCAANEGTLDERVIEFRSGAACCVVLASRGYPEESDIGKRIVGIEDAESIEGVSVLHAGTRRTGDNTLVTAGGRVLCVTATGADHMEAIKRSYAGVELITFEGMQYRRDIGSCVGCET